MDLGLSARKGIVCAASKGLGCAVAFALVREGVNLVINARSEDALQAVAESIRAETGVDVLPVAADIMTEAGRAAVRFGRPEEFGAFAAFLCSTHAGYLTGQNIVLDGGAYPGLT